MNRLRITKLHWKIFFPLVTLIWLIIGILAAYSIVNERKIREENMRTVLLNVNETILDAYNRGIDLPEIVDYITVYNENTILDSLSISIYNAGDSLIADNRMPTIHLSEVAAADTTPIVRHGRIYGYECAYSVQRSRDGKIITISALPLDSTVARGMAIDPWIWVVVIGLGLISSAIAYWGVRQMTRNVYALQKFALDISAGKPIDVENRTFTKDELGDVTASLIHIYNEKSKAVQDKMRTEMLLTRNINHELKTPIGIIKGYLDTITASPDMDAETRQHFLDRSKETADRMVELVKDVSELTKLSEQSKPIEVGPVNFHDLVAELAQDVHMGNLCGDMEFKWDVPADCIVTANYSLLYNAILNFITNGVRYSHGTAMELLQAGTDGKNYTFTFTDNGNGVAESHLPHLFEAFYRVDEGRTRRTGGSGLGLPIVRKTLLAFGGTISVVNATPHGLRFTFTLPRA